VLYTIAADKSLAVVIICGIVFEVSVQFSIVCVEAALQSVAYDVGSRYNSWLGVIGAFGRLGVAALSSADSMRWTRRRLARRLRSPSPARLPRKWLLLHRHPCLAPGRHVRPWPVRGSIHLDRLEQGLLTAEATAGASVMGRGTAGEGAG
jgi:hypothetical protein